MEIKDYEIRAPVRTSEIMSHMPLTCRLAAAAEYPRIEEMIIESFEPITWAKKLDARTGPLNGRDWRTRWHSRMQHIFATQIILAGETEGEIVAASTGTLDRDCALGYIDLLGVDRRFQGHGYGRDMLRGMIAYMKELGALYVNLDCLSDNDTANALYRAEGFEDIARQIRWFRRI
jgi:ribosomal protein S18 acetylase RimI-like enzyme